MGTAGKSRPRVAFSWRTVCERGYFFVNFTSEMHRCALFCEAHGAFRWWAGKKRKSGPIWPLGWGKAGVPSSRAWDKVAIGRQSNGNKINFCILFFN